MIFNIYFLIFWLEVHFNIDNFLSVIRLSRLCTDPAVDVYDFVEQYNNELSLLLDKHAPSYLKTVVLRPHQPWFSNDLLQAKRARRAAERRWLLSGSILDYNRFKDVKNNFNFQLYQAKSKFFTDKALSCGSDSKALFRTIGEILYTKNLQNCLNMTAGLS